MRPEDNPLWKWINSDLAAVEERIFKQMMNGSSFDETIDLIKGTDGVWRATLEEKGCEFKTIPVGITSRFAWFDEADGGPDETVYQRRSPNGQTTTGRIVKDWRESRDPVAALQSVRATAERVPVYRNFMDLLGTIPVCKPGTHGIVVSDSGYVEPDKPVVGKKDL